MSPLSHGELVQMEASAKSPVEIIFAEQKEIFENGIIRVVQDSKIKVNKAELIRALELDKELREGKLVEVIRCEHCQHAEEQLDGRYCCYLHDAVFEADYFCKDGEEAPNVSP